VGRTTIMKGGSIEVFRNWAEVCLGRSTINVTNIRGLEGGVPLSFPVQREKRAKLGLISLTQGKTVEGFIYRKGYDIVKGGPARVLKWGRK